MDKMQDLEDTMPQRVRQLILEGACSFTAEEWDPEFLENFFSLYEDIIDQVMSNNLDLERMKYIPLEFDAAHRTFQFLSEFKENAHPRALAIYRDIFQNRYTSIFEQDDSSENYEDEFADSAEAIDNRPLPRLPYRTPNDEYVSKALAQLISTEGGIWRGPYGFIEDRKQLFIQSLSGLCTEYALPKFPIYLDDWADKFCFIASHDEIDIFRKLLFQRQKEIDPIKMTLWHENLREQKQIDSAISSNKRTALSKQCKEKFRCENKKLNDFYQQKWAIENQDQSFSSAIDSYICDTMESLVENRELTDCPIRMEQIETSSSRIAESLKSAKPGLN